jgi:preprotein translocase subunit SecG
MTWLLNDLTWQKVTAVVLLAWLAGSVLLSIVSTVRDRRRTAGGAR